MRAGVAAILALGLVAGRVGQADPTEDAAQVHLDRGIAAFDAGDFAAAKHELTAASELAPHKPNPYRWLALTEVQLGDCPHALDDIASFEARVQPDDARLPELERLGELCKTRSVDPPPPSVVETRPPPPAAPPPEAHHARWWLWAGLGALAVVAVGVVVYATHDGGPTTLPPVTCLNDAGCAPGLP